MPDLSQFTHLDTTKSLDNPRLHELSAHVDWLLCSGLWKIGSCFEDQLGTRPQCASHYNPQYFNRDGAVLIAFGLVDTAYAVQLETVGIQRAKFNLRTGVNTKSRDGVPHDHYSPVRPGALYAVPVRLDVATTQDEFKQVHVSYYFKRKGKVPLRRSEKRAKLLDELIDAIPMQQLRRAFESPTSPRELWKLQRKHDFKESNKEIYMELRALFDERY